MSLPPFTFDEINERLEYIFIELDKDVIEKFTQFDIQTQDALLSLIEKASTTSHGLAFQFGKRLPRAFELMEMETLEIWLNQAIDAFDNKGLYHAIDKLNELESVAKFATDKLTGIAFDDVSGILEPFVIGLNGRKLKIDAGTHWHTDTETIFLPSMLNHFSEKQDNFSLYKCLAVHLWAQSWFGTWRVDLQQSFESFDDKDRATEWFHILEAIRLDARIAEELPGIHREMHRLCRLADSPPLCDINIPHVEILYSSSSTAHDSLEILAKNYHLEPPAVSHYHGCIKPQAVEDVRNRRLIQEKDLFRTAIAQIIEDKTGKTPEQLTEDEKLSVTAVEIPDADMLEGFTYQLQLDGDPIEPPDGVKSLMDSIIQDIGLIPDDYLVAAGDGGYKIDAEDNKPDSQNVWSGTYHEEGAFLHKEWDFRQKRHKKNWCAVRELEITPLHNRFVEKTLEKYAGLVKSLRRTFEVLRGEDKTLKRQPHGDDIDIDALVEALADVHSGMEMSERIFTKMHKEERNIAVIFMVDMSGSTKGWINEAEREALILLSEALETLGDRYAIYGFSSTTRKRCEVFKIKTFDEPYNNEVKGRISNIQPQEYTRLGVFIRHFTQMFNDVDAKTKLLITLSDGKPEDYDGYRGEYGIEDTRMALLEAKREGIHPFCITIDNEARDYLPHMYGAANYIVLDEVNKLPLKVADIYRHITS